MLNTLFRHILFFVLLTGCFLGHGQTANIDGDSTAVSDTNTTGVIAAADTNLVDEDALAPIFIPQYEFIPEYTDEQIKDRLSCAENEVRLTYNPKINSFIDFFVRRRREYSMMVLQRKNLYFPIFERILKEHGMPDEIKYLAIVESGLKPRAISPSSAVGLWQFIPSTGRHYGLKIDSYIDERLDPEKSTVAACRYLKWLYNSFGDWQLALASYNCGPGYVSRARKRARVKGDFWQIYNHLPAETRSYVPQFIAISYLMHYSDVHNLFPPYREASMISDTVMVNGYCDLNTMAQILKICPEDINQLNLELKRNVIPAYIKSYVLKLPIDVMAAFRQNRQAILDSCAVVKPSFLIAKSTRFETTTSLNEPTKTYSNSKLYYKVRSGDNLLKIATKHGVSIVQLKKWNHLSSSKIRLGQTLVIYGISYTKAKQSNYNSIKATQSKSKPSRPSTKPKSAGKTHTVRQGDTLYQISKKYGISVGQLKKINNINSNGIQVGQRIKIN